MLLLYRVKEKAIVLIFEKRIKIYLAFTYHKK